MCESAPWRCRWQKHSPAHGCHAPQQANHRERSQWRPATSAALCARQRHRVLRSSGRSLRRVANANLHHRRWTLRRGRLPRRSAHAGNPCRMVRTARQDLKRTRNSKHHAVVLEHRSRLGDGTPVVAGAWLGVLGVPLLQHLGQRAGPHRRQRQHAHSAQVPRGNGSMRSLCEGGTLQRGWHDPDDAVVAAPRVVAHRLASTAGKRGMRGVERGHAQAPHRRSPLVLPAT